MSSVADGRRGPWRISDFHADDLDAAVRLWDNPASSGEAPAFGLGKEEVTMADVLRGIAEVRRTLTPELVAEFEQDIQAYARV